MSQSIRVTCIQSFDGSTVKAIGEHESDDMSMAGWRNAITSAAIAAGFHPHVLHALILEWAGDIESGAA